MGFDASFRATHRGCRFGYVHVFPVTHQESFPLTRRQLFYFFFNQVECLGLQQHAFRGAGARIILVGGEGFERVVVFVIVRGEGGKQRCPHGADLASPVVVPDRILKDPLKQHGKLVVGTVAVFFGQLEHRILNDIERGIFIADGKYRLLEGSALD